MENGALFDTVDNYGCTVLWTAAFTNHVQTLRLLLEKGADPDCQPYDKEKYATPLYNAANYNHPEVCELLLNFGADIDRSKV